MSTLAGCNRPKSIHIAENARTSAKKVKAKNDAVSTLNKISEALQRIRKPECIPSAYNSTIPSQKFGSNRKLLNNTSVQCKEQRFATSVKRKRSNEIIPRGEIDSSEIDSAAIITDATVTAKRIEESNKYMEYKKAILHNLNNNLKAAEREKSKSDQKQILDKKFGVINEAFKDVIALDNSFKSLLKNIQLKFQELFNDHTRYNKSLRDNFSSEIAKAQMEMTKQKVKYESLKTEQNKLLKEAKERLEIIKNQEKIIIELKSMDNEAERVNDKNLIESLHKENKKLSAMVKKSHGELRNSKKREKALIKLLKEDNDSSSLNIQASKKALNKTTIEVGKQKVRIPVLNLVKMVPNKPFKLKVVKYYKGNIGEVESSSEGKVECNRVGSEEEECGLPLDNFLEKIGAVSNNSDIFIKTS
jgi:hypothetical protein